LCSLFDLKIKECVHKKRMPPVQAKANKGHNFRSE